MWSRAFLWTGVISGGVIAALSLAGIWLVLFAAFGGGDPNWTPANGMKFGVVGLFVYPVCWAILIHRTRDYSVRRTAFLVAVTYAAACGLVIGILFLGMFYPVAQLVIASLGKPQATGFALLSLSAPFIMAFFALVAAGVIGIAYAAVAAPLAFLHRYLMLKQFAPSDVATPTAT